MSDAIKTLPDEVPNCVKISLEAWVTGYILDQDSREVVGWLYEWNTGERQPMWRDGPREDIMYEYHDQRRL